MDKRNTSRKDCWQRNAREKNFLANVFIFDDEVKHKDANLLKFDGITEENDIQYSDVNIDACKLDVLYNKDLLGKYIEGNLPYFSTFTVVDG